MNTNNNQNKIKIILGIAFTIIVSLVIVNIFSRNVTTAGTGTPLCPLCGTSDNVQCKYSSSTSHYYTCSYHDATISTASHT